MITSKPFLIVFWRLFGFTRKQFFAKPMITSKPFLTVFWSFFGFTRKLPCEIAGQVFNGETQFELLFFAILSNIWILENQVETFDRFLQNFLKFLKTS